MRLKWVNKQNSTARSIALGTFDGVHRGHQKLLEETIARKPANGTSCVFTFDTPPEQYFRDELRLVSSFERRVELFRSFGIDEVVWLTFGPELTSMEAEDFVQRVLVNEVRATEVICGYNYRFGSNRGGDSKYLEEQGRRFGFSVTVVPPVQDANGQVISSTVIRRLIREGNISQAADYLGYYPMYRGVAESSVSSVLTFDVNANLVVPDLGTYLVWCVLPHNQGIPAIAWPSPKQGFEIALLDSGAVLNTGLLDVQFLARLRSDESGEPIETDVLRAQQLLPGFYLQDGRVVLE
ncbi:MAG TPA: hypothetical protein GXZ85_07115 [Firmicutes bacterium]|nr:hypothetical protein [Bacillota bacterium]